MTEVYKNYKSINISVDSSLKYLYLKNYSATYKTAV